MVATTNHAFTERGARSRAGGTWDWAAILLLLLGGFALGVGWLLGLILMWGSRTWATGDKLIATLILPGGLAGGLVLFALGGGRGTLASNSSSCKPMPHSLFVNCSEIIHGGTTPSAVRTILLLMAALSPLATTVRLARLANRVHAS